MFESSLIPAKTTITTKGDGDAVDVSGTAARVFLVTLKITEIVEQEALELSVHGSSDGQSWTAKPILTFPQQFYTSETPMLLDLSGHADIKFVRAHWEVNRWGRGPETPRFEVEASLREVPVEMLQAKRK
jgi:hypothetical protein